MEKQRKIKTLRNIFEEYNHILNDNKFNQSEEVQEKINSIQIESKKYLKERMFFAIAFCIMLVLFFLNIAYFFKLSNLEKESQCLQNNIIEYEKMIEALKSRDSLFNQIEIDVNSFSEEMKESFYRLNGLNNNLELRIDSVNDENSKMKAILNCIEKKYDITFKETDKYITIESSKLDSILSEIPYYRDKLKYNYKITIHPSK